MTNNEMMKVIEHCAEDIKLGSVERYEKKLIENIENRIGRTLPYQEKAIVHDIHNLLGSLVSSYRTTHFAGIVDTALDITASVIDDINHELNTTTPPKYGRMHVLEQKLETAREIFDKIERIKHKT